MIPKTNSADIQMDILNKVREVYEVDLSDRMLLISVFSNYRTGGGLRLSDLGYNICVENSLFEFTKVPFKKNFKNSLVLSQLDRVCTSPYYIKDDYIFLSDDLVLAQLTICSDEFDKMFKAFL